MGMIETRTFKSGNSVAVRLPKEFGYTADIAVTIEQDGTALVVRPKIDPVEEKRRLDRMMKALQAIGPVGEIEERCTDIPERPGL